MQQCSMYDARIAGHVGGMLETLHRDELRVGGGDTIGVQLVLAWPGMVIWLHRIPTPHSWQGTLCCAVFRTTLI